MKTEIKKCQGKEIADWKEINSGEREKSSMDENYSQ